MSQANYPNAATMKTMIAPVSQAATVTGSAIDLIEYECKVLIVQHKGLGTGTLDGKIQDSPDGTTGWADVAGATFTQSGTAADIKSLWLDTRSVRRFVRYVGTIVTGPHLLAVELSGVPKIV